MDEKVESSAFRRRTPEEICLEYPLYLKMEPKHQLTMLSAVKEAVIEYSSSLQQWFEGGYSYHATHVPSGENWHIIGIDVKGNRVCAAGYPATIAKLSDCKNFTKFNPLTEQELKHRERKFGTNWL